MNALLNWRGHAWLALAARLYLAHVFLFACWFKIIDPAAFALSVATYQLLPLSLINVTALVMPWAELLAGAMMGGDGGRIITTTGVMDAILASFSGLAGAESNGGTI